MLHCKLFNGKPNICMHKTLSFLKPLKRPSTAKTNDSQICWKGHQLLKPMIPNFVKKAINCWNQWFPIFLKKAINCWNQWLPILLKRPSTAETNDSQICYMSAMFLFIFTDYFVYVFILYVGEHNHRNLSNPPSHLYLFLFISSI